MIIDGRHLKVHELIDLMTNPKWWPDGVVDMNAKVCFAADGKKGECAVAMPVTGGSVQPILESEKEPSFYSNDAFPIIRDEDQNIPGKTEWVFVIAD